MPDKKDNYVPVAGAAPGLPPMEEAPLQTLLDPIPAPFDVDLSYLLNMINDTSQPPMEIGGDWKKVKDALGVSLWAATRGGESVTLKPVVPGLKLFLKKLYESEGTQNYLSMDCRGVEVCFFLRTPDQPGLDDWTPPAAE
ncbi:hypothetical protein ACJ41O_011839 [Fusarium nematophilum]